MENKKSFFEKITGTKSFTEQNPQIQTNINPQIQQNQHNFTAQKTQTQQAQEVQKPIQQESFSQQPAPKQEFQPSIQERIPTRNKQIESEGQLVLDVYQTDREIVIKSTLAGIVPEDLDIMITNDMLTIMDCGKKMKKFLPLIIIIKNATGVLFQGQSYSPPKLSPTK